MAHRLKGPTSEQLARRVHLLEETLWRISAELEACGITPGLTGPSVEIPALRLLTRRQSEVLSCLRRGMRVPTIAREFHISPSTVRNHLKSIFRKLDVASQQQLLEKLDPRAGSRQKIR